MNPNSEITPVQFPRTVRLLEQEERAAAICRRYKVKPVDLIRHAVQRFCEQVEGKGRYDTPPVGVEGINLRHKEGLARKENANRRSSGGTGPNRAAHK